MKATKRISTIPIILLFTFLSIESKCQYHIRGYNLDSAKTYLDSNQLSPIEGIYSTNIGSKIVIEKQLKNGKRLKNKFRKIVLEPSSTIFGSVFAKGEVCGYLESTNNDNVYEFEYYLKNLFGMRFTKKDLIYLRNQEYFEYSYTTSNGNKQTTHSIENIKIYPTPNQINNRKNKISSGTGFLIDTSGIIVTNNHVIDDATKISVIGVNGDFTQKYPAKVLQKDNTNDLAVIQIIDSVNIKTQIPYSIDYVLNNTGKSVFALGYPFRASMGDEIKLTNGIISSETGFKDNINSYQTSVPIQPGNSGAPLFNNEGMIIGIINAKHLNADNASYAIKTAYLKSLIELTGIKLSIPDSTQLGEMALPEQVKYIRNFVYIIESQ